MLLSLATLLSPIFPLFFFVYLKFIYSLIAILYTKIVLGDIVFFFGREDLNDSLFRKELLRGDMSCCHKVGARRETEKNIHKVCGLWKGCPCFYRTHLSLMLYNTTPMSLRKILVLVLVYFFPFNNSFKLDSLNPISQKIFLKCFLKKTKQTARHPFPQEVPFCTSKELSPNILYS